VIAEKSAAALAGAKKVKNANADLIVLALAGAKNNSKNPLQRVFIIYVLR